jgi:anti-sigma regulatory factor (Ser/Thr protein kinase)
LLVQRGGFVISSSSVVDRFCHEALFYANDDEFVAGTVPFIREGIRNAEPILVVESLPRIQQLCSALGEDAAQVEFANMSDVGANPARIIPAWQVFVDQHSDASRLRGIGEPIWAGRTATELVECQRHEALLNTAFASGRPWSLLCPYDVASLSEDVIAEARRSHELLVTRDEVRPSEEFETTVSARAPIDAPFSEPNSVLGSYRFDGNTLVSLRHELSKLMARSGLSRSRAADFVAAVNEIATNSVKHGGGNGTARAWFENDTAVCEIRDAGRIDDPLADRRRPGHDASASRGYWLANQLCDLVQVRSGQSGTSVRLHKRLDRQEPRLSVLEPTAN